MESTPSSVFPSLAAALRERLRVIADREFYQRDPEGHLQALQGVSEQIETLVARLPRPLDPELAHYFQRRSYDKALVWIETRAAVSIPS